MTDSQAQSLVKPELFRAIAGRWLTGVVVVTAMDADGKPVGVTINAFCPLSLAPPQFLICLDHGSNTLAAIRFSKAFAINLLRDEQHGHCATFARKLGDKFTDMAYEHGSSGAPLLTGAIAHAECELEAVHVSGDHSILIGNVIDGQVWDGEPLAYLTGKLRALAPCS